MLIFESFGFDLNYDDILQLDGGYSTCHINYGNSPKFGKEDGKFIAISSRKNSITSNEKIDGVMEFLNVFNGTEKNYNKKDRIALWKAFWIEYINAFKNLTICLPESVVTVYVGRQAIEIGFKFLILKKTGQVAKEHDLGILSNMLYTNYDIKDSYMKDVDSFCKIFCDYIEGQNAEYFRYPEYKKNNFFAGNRLDIKWIAYNFALIILKLIHFSNLDDEI